MLFRDAGYLGIFLHRSVQNNAEPRLIGETNGKEDCH